MFQFPLKSVKISANETITIGEMVSGFGSGIAIVPLMITIKSIAASKALGRINGYKVDTFQEILALGLGNVFGSFFKAIPLTACFGRSAVSSSSGSKTPFTGIVTYELSFKYSFIHSINHFLITSLLYFIIHSFIQLFFHFISFIHSFKYSLIHFVIPSFNHSFTYVLYNIFIPYYSHLNNHHSHCIFSIIIHH